jgi:hypothetical protein
MIFYSCDKNETDSEKEYGNVLFYTNAQFLLNCGEFDVDVYIDDLKKGVISKPFLPLDSIPSCETTDTNTTLKLNMEVGNYNYSADFYCSNNNQWTGNFDIKKDSCTIIYLNLSQTEN